MKEYTITGLNKQEISGSAHGGSDQKAYASPAVPLVPAPPYNPSQPAI